MIEGENTVTAQGYYYPAIHISTGKTLTIDGNGSLKATGGDSGAGIGSGYNGASCGSITITGTSTVVTATKGIYAPNDIGAGKNSSCGTMTKTGGATVNGTVYE